MIERNSSLKITSKKIIQQSKNLKDESYDVEIEMKTDIASVASVESLNGNQENNNDNNNNNITGAPRQMSRKEGQMAKLENTKLFEKEASMSSDKDTGDIDCPEQTANRQASSVL